MTLSPRVYDLVQVMLGVRISRARLAPHLVGMQHASVIDVGGGTALHGQQLPATAAYVCLDLDLDKLQRARSAGSRVLQCDATAIALAPQSVDYALCIALAHHLPDDALMATLREIRRVVRRQLLFVDPVAQDRVSIARLLWSLDAGSHPRTEEQLRAALADSFVCEHVESYEVYHRYFMCIASPRQARIQ